MSGTFNPFGSTVAISTSIVAGLMAQVKASKAIVLRDIEGGNVKTLNDGDGLEAIEVKLSVGNGKGSSRLDLVATDLRSVNELLCEFDPEVDKLSDLTPAECVSRTIQREEVKDSEDIVSFKISLAKNSRSIKVPVSEWAAFVEFMGNLEEWSHGAVAAFRTHVANIEAEANKAPAPSPTADTPAE